MKLSFQAQGQLADRWFCGEGLPTIDLAHADLSEDEQCQNIIAGCRPTATRFGF